MKPTDLFTIHEVPFKKGKDAYTVNRYEPNWDDIKELSGICTKKIILTREQIRALVKSLEQFIQYDDFGSNAL